MKINKVGVSLFIISSLSCLVLLEFGLRVAGDIYNSSRETHFERVDSDLSYDTERDYEEFRSTKSDKNKIIWAIGDSFTNAGNVESRQSYPAYLSKELNRSNYNYSVVNLGQCEDPTWGVHDRLKEQLEISKKSGDLPSIVVFLTGVSDPFYFLFSGTSPIEREKQSIRSFETKDISWFRSLRVYKVYRHIKLNLMNKQLVQQYSKMTPEVMESLNKIYSEITTNRDKITDWKDVEARVVDILKNHKGFVDGSKGEFDFEDKDRFVLNTIAIPLVRGYSGEMKYNKALDVLIQFSKDYPDFFWSDKRNAPFVLHTISQLMMFQSKYTSKEMIEHAKVSTNKNVELRNNKLYQQAIKMFTDRDDLDSVILSSKEKTWDKIIDLSKEYGFKIVLQTYASDFKQANQYIRKLSHEKKLALVDNHKLFVPHIKKHGREVLFADDNHFLPIGYEIMAKNVYEELVRSNYISK